MNIRYHRNMQILAVNLKLTSSLVIVMDENYREIVRHRRLYGDTKQQSMDGFHTLGSFPYDRAH